MSLVKGLSTVSWSDPGCLSSVQRASPTQLTRGYGVGVQARGEPCAAPLDEPGNAERSQLGSFEH